MKVSTKGRYGLRAMVDIALLAGEENHVSLHTIAIRQDISENYLEQIIAQLRKANLVCSLRGAKGGYVLSRPADTITAGEVLRVLEGDLTPVACVTSEEGECGINIVCKKCATKVLWEQIYHSTIDIVDNVTLNDLLLVLLDDEECLE